MSDVTKFSWRGQPRHSILESASGKLVFEFETKLCGKRKQTRTTVWNDTCGNRSKAAVLHWLGDSGWGHVLTDGGKVMNAMRDKYVKNGRIGFDGVEGTIYTWHSTQNRMPYFTEERMELRDSEGHVVAYTMDNYTSLVVDPRLRPMMIHPPNLDPLIVTAMLHRFFHPPPPQAPLSAKELRCAMSSREHHSLHRS